MLVETATGTQIIHPRSGLGGIVHPESNQSLISLSSAVVEIKQILWLRRNSFKGILRSRVPCIHVILNLSLVNSIFGRARLRVLQHARLEGTSHNDDSEVPVCQDIIK